MQSSLNLLRAFDACQAGFSRVNRAVGASHKPDEPIPLWIGAVTGQGIGDVYWILNRGIIIDPDEFRHFYDTSFNDVLSYFAAWVESNEDEIIKPIDEARESKTTVKRPTSPAPARRVTKTAYQGGQSLTPGVASPVTPSVEKPKKEPKIERSNLYMRIFGETGMDTLKRAHLVPKDELLAVARRVTAFSINIEYVGAKFTQFANLCEYLRALFPFEFGNRTDYIFLVADSCRVKVVRGTDNELKKARALHKQEGSADPEGESGGRPSIIAHKAKTALVLIRGKHDSSTAFLNYFDVGSFYNKMKLTGERKWQDSYLNVLPTLVPFKGAQVVVNRDPAGQFQTAAIVFTDPALIPVFNEFIKNQGIENIVAAHQRMAAADAVNTSNVWDRDDDDEEEEDEAVRPQNRRASR